MSTYQQRMLTDVSEKIANRMAQRYGSLKSVLSAGIMALDKLTPVEREYMLDLANGNVPDDPSQQAAESARFCIKKMQSLDSKQFAIALQFLPESESKAIQEMLNILSPEKRPRKNKTG